MSDSFVDGPAIHPSAPAIAWLAEAGKKRIRVPLEVSRGAFGETATLGSGSGAPEIELDTTALSRMFDDYLADVCGSADPCQVWVEGTWGPLVGPPSDTPTLTVRKVVAKVTDMASATVKIQGS